MAQPVRQCAVAEIAWRVSVGVDPAAWSMTSSKARCPLGAAARCWNIPQGGMVGK